MWIINKILLTNLVVAKQLYQEGQINVVVMFGVCIDTPFHVDFYTDKEAGDRELPCREDLSAALSMRYI